MSYESKIEILLKKYSDNSIYRAGLSAIPYIGGALDILLTSGIHKKSQERFQIFLNELENQIKSVDESKLNYSYLESEEFYDLFIQTSNLVIKTRLKEKIKWYSTIMTSSLISDFNNHMKGEDILNIIEGLTENDIRLIKLISEYLESNDAQRINRDTIFMASSFSDLSKDLSEEFIFLGLLRLIKSGLIIKHPAMSAPIPQLKFTITPMFGIIKEFMAK
ncbi:hypothetical protein [Sinomicrobium oceani]|uniref:hypothetical protein n=1 Tax=Sinomicrobium oceani TaxID=1150368 RepID=UPI00227BD845|nr:hypothetical protein [Sinomicrobium oceani]